MLMNEMRVWVAFGGHRDEIVSIGLISLKMKQRKNEHRAFSWLNIGSFTFLTTYQKNVELERFSPLICFNNKFLQTNQKSRQRVMKSFEKKPLKKGNENSSLSLKIRKLPWSQNHFASCLTDLTFKLRKPRSRNLENGDRQINFWLQKLFENAKMSCDLIFVQICNCPVILLCVSRIWTSLTWLNLLLVVRL